MEMLGRSPRLMKPSTRSTARPSPRAKSMRMSESRRVRLAAAIGGCSSHPSGPLLSNPLGGIFQVAPIGPHPHKPERRDRPPGSIGSDTLLPGYLLHVCDPSPLPTSSCILGPSVSRHIQEPADPACGLVRTPSSRFIAPPEQSVSGPCQGDNRLPPSTTPALGSFPPSSEAAGASGQLGIETHSRASASPPSLATTPFLFSELPNPRTVEQPIAFRIRSLPPASCLPDPIPPEPPHSRTIEQPNCSFPGCRQ